jgi:hypothetical protein
MPCVREVARAQGPERVSVLLEPIPRRPSGRHLRTDSTKRRSEKFGRKARCLTGTVALLPCLLGKRKDPKTVEA